MKKGEKVHFSFLFSPVIPFHLGPKSYGFCTWPAVMARVQRLREHLPWGALATDLAYLTEHAPALRGEGRISLALMCTHITWEMLCNADSDSVDLSWDLDSAFPANS